MDTIWTVREPDVAVNSFFLRRLRCSASLANKVKTLAECTVMVFRQNVTRLIRALD